MMLLRLVEYYLSSSFGATSYIVIDVDLGCDQEASVGDKAVVPPWTQVMLPVHDTA